MLGSSARRLVSDVHPLWINRGENVQIENAWIFSSAHLVTVSYYLHIIGLNGFFEMIKKLWRIAL